MKKRRQLNKRVKGKNHKRGSYQKKSQNRKKRKMTTSLGGKFSVLRLIKSQTSNQKRKRKLRKLWQAIKSSKSQLNKNNSLKSKSNSLHLKCQCKENLKRRLRKFKNKKKSQKRSNLRYNRSKLIRNQMKSPGGINSVLVLMISLLKSQKDKSRLTDQELKALKKSNNLLRLRHNLL